MLLPSQCAWLAAAPRRRGRREAPLARPALRASWQAKPLSPAPRQAGFCALTPTQGLVQVMAALACLLQASRCSALLGWGAQRSPAKPGWAQVAKSAGS